MATEKSADKKTTKVNVWLKPEQVEWLKEKKNVSETIRALVTEAMNMDNLARMVKSKKAATTSKKKR